MRVVALVPGEPVDVVHDDVVNLVRTGVVEHALQLGTRGRAPGAAAVDELRRDERTELVCAASVRFTLRRDRVAFLIEAVRGLARCGDAQIGHGAKEELGDVV